MKRIADRLRTGGAVDEEVGDPALGDPEAEPAAIFEPALVADVGTMVPSPVTVATMPDFVPKDCTHPPLMLASTLLPNRCVHCPPTLTRLVRSVPVAIEASNGLKAAAGSV